MEFQVIVYATRGTNGRHTAIPTADFETIRPNDTEAAVVRRLLRRYAPEVKPKEVLLSLRPSGDLDIVLRSTGRKVISLKEEKKRR